MAKTTPKTRSKRAKTPKRPRGKTLVEVFTERTKRARRAWTEVDADPVPAVRNLLDFLFLAVDAGSLEADVYGAIARVQELLP